MKKQLNELFIINDYETGEAMGYYLTNDASACEEALSVIDKIHDDEDLPKSLVEELGEEKAKEIAEEKEYDSWEEAFLILCKCRKIQIKQFENEVSYDY